MVYGWSLCGEVGVVAEVVDVTEFLDEIFGCGLWLFPGGYSVAILVSSEIVQLGSVKGTRNCETNLEMKKLKYSKTSIMEYSIL